MLSRRQILNMKWRGTFVALAILGLFYFSPNLPAGKCGSSRTRIGRNILESPEEDCVKPDCSLLENTGGEDGYEKDEKFNREAANFFKCSKVPEDETISCTDSRRTCKTPIILIRYLNIFHLKLYIS